MWGSIAMCECNTQHTTETNKLHLFLTSVCQSFIKFRGSGVHQREVCGPDTVSSDPAETQRGSPEPLPQAPWALPTSLSALFILLGPPPRPHPLRSALARLVALIPSLPWRIPRVTSLAHSCVPRSWPETTWHRHLNTKRNLSLKETKWSWQEAGSVPGRARPGRCPKAALSYSLHLDE